MKRTVKCNWEKGIVKCFSVDFNRIDANDILDVQRYLMKGK